MINCRQMFALDQEKSQELVLYHGIALQDWSLRPSCWGLSIHVILSATQAQEPWDAIFQTFKTSPWIRSLVYSMIQNISTHFAKKHPDDGASQIYIARIPDWRTCAPLSKSSTHTALTLHEISKNSGNVKTNDHANSIQWLVAASQPCCFPCHNNWCHNDPWFLHLWKELLPSRRSEVLALRPELQLTTVGMVCRLTRLCPFLP